MKTKIKPPIFLAKKKKKKIHQLISLSLLQNAHGDTEIELLVHFLRKVKIKTSKWHWYVCFELTRQNHLKNAAVEPPSSGHLYQRPSTAVSESPLQTCSLQSPNYTVKLLKVHSHCVSMLTFTSVFASNFNMVSKVMLTLMQIIGTEFIRCICVFTIASIIFEKANADIGTKCEWVFRWPSKWGRFHCVSVNKNTHYKRSNTYWLCDMTRHIDFTTLSIHRFYDNLDA